MPSYKGPLSNKHVDQNVSNRPDAVIPLLGFIAVTALMIIKDKERFGKFFTLLKNKQFMITLLGIITFIDLSTILKSLFQLIELHYLLLTESNDSIS